MKSAITNVALISGQLMLQRAVYIRNTYKFRLSWEYCLLDPMDLVTVTDAILGLSNAPIRITEIEEDENGFLQVTAEEFPLGVATATLYPTQPVTNNPINRNVAARSGQHADYLRAAVGAGRRDAAGLDRGVRRLRRRCRSELGRLLMSGCRSTAPRTARSARSARRRGRACHRCAGAFSGTNPDTADTLAVNLAESGGVLSSGSAADAQLGNTLCIVDSELVSYETATLTSANNYSLTTLYRGLYGTSRCRAFVRRAVRTAR